MVKLYFSFEMEPFLDAYYDLYGPIPSHMNISDFYTFCMVSVITEHVIIPISSELYKWAIYSNPIKHKIEDAVDTVILTDDANNYWLSCSRIMKDVAFVNQIKMKGSYTFEVICEKNNF